MALPLRRPLLLASVVTATLAGFVALRAIVGGGSSDPAPFVADEPSPSPPATTAGGSPQASPGPAHLTAADPVLEKHVFGAGEPVTVFGGLGFLSAETGALETWTQLGASSPGYYPISSSPDGALLFYSDGHEGSPQYVVERASNKTWKLPPQWNPLPDAAHGGQFFLSDSSSGRQQLVLASAADGQSRPAGFEVAGNAPLRVIISPDGLSAAVLANSELDLLALPALKPSTLVAGLDPKLDSLTPLPAALGVAVEHQGSSTRRWFSWDGHEVDSALPAGQLSPNGKYLETQQTPGAIKGGGEGPYPTAGAVLVMERGSNKAIVQVLGSDPVYVESPWASTSDAVVVQVRDGYRLVGLDGSIQASIPDDIQVLDPRPSPTIKGLLGTNRGTIINVARGTTIQPNYRELVWRAHWSARPGELIVELTTPGKGRGWPENVMPFETRTDRPGAPRIWFPPTFAVRTPGDCLNLREKPAAAAPTIECMADGLTGVAEATDDPDPPAKPESPPQKYAGVLAADGTTWLHLRMDDGKVGWADARYLAWAK
jgi:hypothetical protein